MIKTVRDNLLAPLLGRIGTVAATWLVANDVSNTNAEHIVLGIVATGLVCFDLVSSWAARKWGVR